MDCSIEITLRALHDITGAHVDADAAIPADLIDYLELNYPGTVVSTTISRNAPKHEGDIRHALLPTTTVVVKITPLVWNAIKALMKLYAAVQFYAVGQSAGAALTAGSALESFSKMKESVESLDADGGEYCTYLTVVQAADPIKRSIGLYPSADDARKTHEQYRRQCQRFSCQHHKNGVCTISAAARDEVVVDLIKRKILVKQPGDCLWVTL